MSEEEEETRWPEWYSPIPKRSEEELKAVQDLILLRRAQKEKQESSQQESQKSRKEGKIMKDARVFLLGCVLISLTLIFCIYIYSVNNRYSFLINKSGVIRSDKRTGEVWLLGHNKEFLLGKPFSEKK